ncbi:flagellar protein FlgN [Novosphingobium sp. TH158]|uniref:flagellar protein FlgN n=1 Tax=Novosphingobium sp. TH158 TaxID=2067455 RepID=UPI0020B154A3|nr:flagellar protein FlgN [Novosphingobium sp. TH158]
MSQLRDQLRQMVAVLEDERQALAGLDLDGIVGASQGKTTLCDVLAEADAAQVDEECRGLLEAARRLNEVNRQVRNLIAANVSARLDALTGSASLYRASPAYAYAGAR